ncbi:cyanophycinase [Undibacterium sp. TJN25]|uniref:cyanophycinase n=1 Tax=Undibacterium sp. TJN25 TaxID=3413056 RepID=UPI003BF3E628
MENTVQQQSGTLVIIGGALRVDNSAVWERIVMLAGGKGAKIAVFPCAASRPAHSAALTIQALQKYGACAFMVPVAVKLEGCDCRTAADDPAIAEQVRTADGVYFVGGDQGRITQALLRPDGSRSLVLDAVWELYRKGGVIAGNSAGAAIMSTWMFDDAPAVLPALKRGISDDGEMAPGLGFIGPDVFIDQHLVIRGRFARMLPAMLKMGYRTGLGIDENTAMVVSGGSDVEIVGYRGAVLIDLSQATVNEGTFNISNARLSYLDNGDRYNFHSGLLTLPADKREGRLELGPPYRNGARFYPAILANATLLDLLQALACSRQQRAVGLAFGGPDDDMPALGFEFTFSKAEDSEAYFSSLRGAETYTVMNMRLDVRPVEMQLPLYRHI